MKRRAFLKNTGVMASGLAASSIIPNAVGETTGAESNNAHGGNSAHGNNASKHSKVYSRQPGDDRPNILVILVDQLRFPQGPFNQELMDLAAPHLAELRQKSVSFDNHFTAATMCSPSRAALLTGLYTHQNGMFLTNTQGLVGSIPTPSLDPGFPTWGSVLKSAEFGYNTYWWGKWHLSGNDQTTPDYAKEYGFTTGGLPCPAPNGAPGQGLGVDPVTASVFKNWLTDSAKSGSGPWCTTVSLVNPHDIAWYPGFTRGRPPFGSSQGTLPQPGEDNPPPIFHDLPANFESWPEALTLQGKPTLQQVQVLYLDAIMGEMPTNSGAGFPELWHGMLDLYFQVTNYVDRQIGAVLDALANSDAADNTIVIFTADHGEYGGAHGLRNKGFANYEESIHVPLYAFDPTGTVIPSGQIGTVRDELTSHVDILPLLMTLASGGNAWRNSPAYAHLADRADLTSMLSNPDAKGRDYILHTSDEDIPSDLAAVAGTSPTELNDILESLGQPPSHVIGYRTKSAKLGVYSFFAPGTINIVPGGQQAELYNYQQDGIDEVINHAPSSPAPDPALYGILYDALFNPTSGAVVTELRKPLPSYLEEAQSRAFATYLEFEAASQGT